MYQKKAGTPQRHCTEVSGRAEDIYIKKAHGTAESLHCTERTGKN
jgi:hypothetical protein